MQTGGYASSHDCRVSCGLRSADRKGAGRRSGGARRLGRDRQAPVARQKAGGRLCAVRAGLPGLCHRHRRCVRPRIPGFSPGGLGPHLTSSGFPCGLSSGFPFARRVLPPSPAFLWFPFVRRSPVRSLRPLPGSGSPSVSLRAPFPLSNSHVNAAAGRFRRHRSRAAGTKVTSPAAATSPGSRDPPALQMGSGWAGSDAATESPVTSGRERRTSPRPNRPDRRLLAPRSSSTPIT